MKVLVTGGTGFIGSTLVRHLLAAGYEVKILARHKKNSFLLEGLNVEIIDGDVTRPAAVEKAVQGCSVVFNLASIYAFYPFWERNPRAIYKANVQGTINLLEASLKYGVKRFIHTSTIATIDKERNKKASDEHSGFNFKKASHYARSKYLAEQEVLKFCQKGLDVIILNPGIVIGERDYKPTPSGDVIVKFLNRNYPGYFDTLWAVADADDIARAHIAAIENGKTGERYILCNKNHWTLKEIFQILEKISGIKAPRIKIPYFLLLGFVYVEEFLSHFLFKKKPLMPTEGVRFCKMSIVYDNSKAVRELGYQSTPIEETFTKAVNWYRRNAYVQPPGFFRVKAHGSKAVAFLMRKMGMDRLTDKLHLDTFVFFLGIKFLRLLWKLGFPPRRDGWRRITESYLRTERSKFSLAVFGLDYLSDTDKKINLTSESAKQHLVTRLAEFLKQHPMVHYQMKWKRLSVGKEVKRAVDLVIAEFDKTGNLKKIELFLDDREGGQLLNGISGSLKDYLVQGVVQQYNETKNLGDAIRPLVLRQKLKKWLASREEVGRGETKDCADYFLNRILSATFVSFETLPANNAIERRQRFDPPAFIKCKHPGFGVLNVVCRFSETLDKADLWFQFCHVPIDGVPAQEMLNHLKRQWGKAEEVKFPEPDENREMVFDLCSTGDSGDGIYHSSQFIDFQAFIRLKKELNKRFSNREKENITAAAFLIWKLAQFPEFEDVKFAVPIDLRATQERERTLGFIFLRPSVYFDKDRPDRGFFRFQQEFNRQLFETRRRRSESYQLLETYAVAPPLIYSAALKFLPNALREFAGTVGITIIKKADFFVAPCSDVHSDGFIAFSNFSLPSESGKKVCIVSIKGRKEKVEKYAKVINDIMHRAIKYDELYF